MNDDQLSWKELSRTAEQDYRIFSVYRNQSIHEPSGRVGQFSIVNSANWVNIIPITDDDEVVFVRQYRHGTAEITLEIPGGLVDPGESYVEAGLRELQEETGYVAAKGKLMGVIDPNPAFLNNHCGLVLAEGVHQLCAQQLDANEVIDVVRYPLTDIPNLILSGQIKHTLVISAFYMLDRHRAHA